MYEDKGPGAGTLFLSPTLQGKNAHLCYLKSKFLVRFWGAFPSSSLTYFSHSESREGLFFMWQWLLYFCLPSDSSLCRVHNQGEVWGSLSLSIALMICNCLGLTFQPGSLVASGFADKSRRTRCVFWAAKVPLLRCGEEMQKATPGDVAWFCKCILAEHHEMYFSL